MTINFRLQILEECLKIEYKSSKNAISDVLVECFHFSRKHGLKILNKNVRVLQRRRKNVAYFEGLSGYFRFC